MTAETTKKPLFSNRDLFHLIVPLIVTQALQLIVGMIDSVMVASVGEAAVSGVSLVDSLVQLLIYVFSAMAAGGAIVAGQLLGAGRQDSARKAAGELMRLNILLSLVVTIILFACSRWILSNLFGTIEEEVFYHGERYMTVVLFSLPAIAVFEAASALFRTMRDTKTTMLLSLLMNLLNCSGNALLIYGFHLGTQGAALSTVVSRWMAALVLLGLLFQKKRALSLSPHPFSPIDKTLVKHILTMGIPNGLENGMFQFGKIALLGFVSSFGTAAITANAVTQTMASIEMIPGSAISLATVTVISLCVGQGDYQQAKAFNRKLLVISTACVSVFTGALLIVQPLIAKLYGLSPETAELTASMFRWHALGGVLLWPAAFNLPASLRAAGDVRFPMVLSILSMWVFRWGGAYVLHWTLGLGPVSAWISMAILDWGFRAIVYLLRWHTGVWQQKAISCAHPEWVSPSKI